MAKKTKKGTEKKKGVPDVPPQRPGERARSLRHFKMALKGGKCSNFGMAETHSKGQALLQRKPTSRQDLDRWHCLIDRTQIVPTCQIEPVEQILWETDSVLSNQELYHIGFYR